MSATSDTSQIAASRWVQPVAGQTEGRIGFWLTTATAVVVVVAAVLYLAQALQWRAEPFAGALLTRTLTVDGSLPVDAGRLGGLERWLAARRPSSPPSTSMTFSADTARRMPNTPR